MTYYGQFGVAYAGKATYKKKGSATFTLSVPGTPVAAWLYLAGSDVKGEPGKHFSSGDSKVHVVITNAGGTATFDDVPVRYKAARSFLNRLDITAGVVAGDNTIAVSKYNVNHPEGAFAVAVYESADLPRTRTDIFEGADHAWYPWKPPFGPDTEAVISTFDPYPLGDRAGRITLFVAGAEKGRGDEVFLFTGAGDPAVLIPDSDGDALPDITDRRWRLNRKDRAPLGNDKADNGGHLEAVAGAISLEEDKLGVLRKNRGMSYGPELDIFSAPYTIPADHTFSAFQIQSENAETGDSFVLYLAVNNYEVPEGFNPLPNIIVTKEPKLATGAPGLMVDFTFTVTAAGGDEALENVQLSDDPFLAITGPDSAGDLDADGELDLGEAWVYHATAIFTEVGEFPDVVTATGTGVDSGLDVSDTDDALVIVTPPPEPDFTLAKTASIEIGSPGDLVSYEFTLTNTGGVSLVDVAVHDDVLGDLGTVTLGIGESRKLYVYSHVLPDCGQGGATLSTACNDEVFETNACSLTNTVTATWGALTRTAWDCVDIRKPAFEIAKTASIESGMPGDPVTYEFTVTNTGQVRLVGVAVVDDVLGYLGTYTLEIGESRKLYVIAHPLPDCGQGGATLNTLCSGEAIEANACSLKNTVEAKWGTLTRSAWDCVDIRKPAYTLAKSASIAEGFPGDLVTYEFTLVNTGEMRLVDVVVNDDKLGYIGKVTLEVGATEKLYKTDYPLPACTNLDLTEEHVCGSERVADDRCSDKNVATATWGEIERTADDCVEIKKRPNYTLAKTASVHEGFPGDLVTYEFTLVNTGEMRLVDVVVNDDKLGYIGKVTLEVGATEKLYKTDYPLPSCLNAELTEETLCDGRTIDVDRCSDRNVATSKWGDLTRTATDCIVIKRVLPVIAVTKTADPTFGYLCEYIPGDDWGPEWRSDWTVVSKPMEVAYTFAVTNPGIEPLKSVSVSDETTGSPLCTDPVRTEREGDDELLDPGETWTYEQTCTYTEVGTFPDTVTATGWGEYSEAKVEDQAPASVEAVTGGICDGKIATLTLRYDGLTANIQVVVQSENSAFGDENVAFDGTVQPGETFSFGPLFADQGGFDGTLGTNVTVYVNGVPSTSIHTSCSQPIYVGQAWGEFTIIAGTSKNGGALCPLAIQ